MGEPVEQMMEMVDVSTPHLPKDKVRYLMGVGYPVNLVDAAMRGVDLFDCVIPTRSGRLGTPSRAKGSSRSSTRVLRMIRNHSIRTVRVTRAGH